MIKSKESIDVNTKWIIVATIIASFIGAFIGAAITGWYNDFSNKEIMQKQQKNEIKTLANEYLNDITFIDNAESNFEDYIFNPNSSFNDKNTRYYHSTIWWQDPIYPQWGMYYSNRQDIAKFESNVSRELIIFYGMVLTAESQREQYNNYDKLYERNVSDLGLEQNREQNLVRIFSSMAQNINKSRSQIQQIRTDLQNITNS